MKSFISAILSGDLSSAKSMFDTLLKTKTNELINTTRETHPLKIESEVDVVESMISKMVVRGGKVKRAWTTASGSSMITIKGKAYRGKRAQVDKKTGRRKEVNRSEAQIRAKVIKMKRRWRTTMRAKLPQLLRKRAQSMKITHNLGL